ncbi:MAG: penicillin-binding protein activator [Desulfovibrio sp.]|jgi:hypothetical protein|nr:penicillin-binding protein activator [Desulfovibrio sp.]
MTALPKPLWPAGFGLVLFFLFLTSLNGCIKHILPGTAEGGDHASPVMLNPLDEGRSAFLKGDYGNAEAIALRLLASEGGLSTQDRAEAGRLLAASALHNNHPSVAVSGLDSWKDAEPGADARKEWQDIWCRALRSLSSHDARTRADDVYQDAARPSITRAIAGVVLAVRQWEDKELGQSPAALESIYASAHKREDKALIEGRLAMELKRASPEAVALISFVPTPENRIRFPYNIILIDALLRQTRDQATRQEAEAALDSLNKEARLADTSLFNGAPAESALSFHVAGQAPPLGPIAGKPVVLILPQGGQYTAISGKIAMGARIVCDEISATGNTVSLIVIDSDQPDWIASVNALPKNITIIGGPLRRDDYVRAKSQGLTQRRALLTFLPKLEDGDEGRVAWRFFSSAQDQVDSLLAFTSRLGIRGYGLFYPEENFGQRMSALFEERANALGGVKKIVKASYAPGDSNNWMAAASNLVSANNAGTSFQAVFLPDTWKNMEAIVPNFFYYNETRQVLMGTSLWEQGLAGNSVMSPQYYGLAIFPGSWNSARPTAAGEKLQSSLAAAGKGPADFWVGLGADFARASIALGLNEQWTPENVNAALQGISIDWSMAPIRWREGVATQQMMIFTPRQGGFEEVSWENFQRAFAEAWR